MNFPEEKRFSFPRNSKNSKNMGDVQVMHSQSTEVKTKTKKVKKTTTKQRRESDVQITEIEPTQEELERGYVSLGLLYNFFLSKYLSKPFFLHKTTRYSYMLQIQNDMYPQ